MAFFHPLRLNPPDRSRLSFSMATDSAAFVVRVLPATGLEGAFRVHLSPESLERLGLKVGDICEITGEHTTGYGIAWRATDKMGNSPKVRPAKMTDMLRTAFGFKEGSHVTITKTATAIVHASKVTLSDVTPDDYNNQPDVEDGRWEARARITLEESEAVAAGTTFDISAKKRLRKRFHVEHITGGPKGAPALFYCDDRTEFVVSHGSQGGESPPHSLGDSSFPSLLDTCRIGGLVEQVKELNNHLDYVLNKSHSAATRARYPLLPCNTLIHGYEGTGKSKLLNLVRETHDGPKVFTIEMDSTIAKTQSHVEFVFNQAIAAAPSIILIDDLEDIGSKQQRALVRCLAKAMDRLEKQNVIIVAATRNPTDLESSLLKPHRFAKLVELPIPDTLAREQMLASLLDGFDTGPTLAATVSLKTHGFTPEDLVRLTNEAQRHAIDSPQEREDWVNVHARVSMLHSATNSPTADASLYSQATTEVGNNNSRQSSDISDGSDVFQPLKVSMVDFEHALTKVRPTALREVFLEKPKVHWSDIGGSDTLKTHFDTAIGLPLHHADLMAEYGIKPSKGVLMYGPPGCAKTMTAQAVATMYDLNFIAVKGAELISMYVGESERAVREVFRKARQAAPCVVFFDEIDSIGSEREAGGSKGLNVLTTLLNEMDGFETMKNVMVLAATNRPEVLDPALLRPGRFDSHVYVGLPAADARREILGIALAGATLQPADLLAERLVADTEGYSGAEITGICTVAKTRALTRGLRDGAGSRDRGVVTVEDFEDACRKVQRGVGREMLEGYEAFAQRGAGR